MNPGDVESLQKLIEDKQRELVAKDPDNPQVQSLVHDYARMHLVSRGSVALGRPVVGNSLDAESGNGGQSSRREERGLFSPIVPQNDSLDELQRVQREIYERIQRKQNDADDVHSIHAPGDKLE